MSTNPYYMTFFTAVTNLPDSETVHGAGGYVFGPFQDALCTEDVCACVRLAELLQQELQGQLCLKEQCRTHVSVPDS